uniref:Cilia and flagella associated protein 161 n=1 Tax=Sus scrofa TaxID=9823 RepID=A0A4X1UQT5_PIG
MAKNLYGPGVRMGNWNEDVYLEEERMRDFLAKRDEGQLLIQKNRRLKENLLRPMQLSVSEDGYIHYGDKVMLVNPDHPEVEADLFLGGDLSLCMTPDEIKAYLSDELEVPCGLSAAQTKIPVGRNTFTILCAAGEVIGQVVRYGQNFRLGIAGGFEGRMFYLSSDHRTLMKSSKRSWLQEVYLTDEDSYLNCWQAAFPDPQLRLEYEGFPIPANAKILINHCHTNRGLVAHRHLFLRTFFNTFLSPELHRELHYKNFDGVKNPWMLVTGNPRKNAPTVLDLPKPPAEGTRALEQVAETPGRSTTPGAHACSHPL